MINTKLFLRQAILPLTEIDKNLPSKGKIVELGCGEGTIANYLAVQRQRIVIGIDKNKKRLPKYFKNNLSFKKADITKSSLPKADAYILSDVLHHIKKSEQNKILERVYAKLARGGILVIKEIDTKEFLRSRLSCLWDFLLYPSEKIEFRNSDELIQRLNQIGFKVAVKRPCRLFPGSTTLFICKK